MKSVTSQFRTYDRESDSLRFFTVEKLGEKQSLTPEGFLVVEGVPIARTGTMVYGPNEVPLPAGPDGVIKVHRDEAEVFRPEYIASYTGKPIVDDHPDVDVNPDNWKDYAVGTVLNPRRGSGVQTDLLVADFIVTDKDAIKAIREGKREVSCGYDADYEEIKPGEGKQTNMIGNHVALVDAGRCGPRCAIGDKQHKGVGKMSTKTSSSKIIAGKALDSWVRRLKNAFKAKDEEGFEEALSDMPAEDAAESGGDGEHMHVHVHGAAKGDAKFTDEDFQKHIDQNAAEHAAFEQRLAALEAAMKGSAEGQAAAADENKEVEGQLEEEAPKGTGDKARKARDSMYLEDSFQETVALAEILVPGIRIPTFDRAADPKKSLDSICKLRRSALDLAYNHPADRGMIEELNGKALQLEGMSCAAVRQLFRAVVAVKKTANSKQTTDTHHVTTAAGVAVKGAVRTPADLNKRLAEIYGNK